MSNPYAPNADGRFSVEQLLEKRRNWLRMPPSRRQRKAIRQINDELWRIAPEHVGSCGCEEEKSRKAEEAYDSIDSVLVCERPQFPSAALLSLINTVFGH